MLPLDRRGNLAQRQMRGRRILATATLDLDLALDVLVGILGIHAFAAVDDGVIQQQRQLAGAGHGFEFGRLGGDVDQAAVIAPRQAKAGFDRVAARPRP